MELYDVFVLLALSVLFGVGALVLKPGNETEDTGDDTRPAELMRDALGYGKDKR